MASIFRSIHTVPSRRAIVKSFVILLLFLLSFSFVGVGQPLLKTVYAPSTGATLTEWAVPTASSGPANIILDSSGNCCWFVESFANKIAHFDPASNTFQEWVIPTASSQPLGIAAATISSQTAIIGTEGMGNKMFVFFPTTGLIKEYALPVGGSFPEYVSIEPGGSGQTRAWFSEAARNAWGELVYDPALPNADIFEDVFPGAVGGIANGVYAGSGTIWFAGATSIARFDRASLQYTMWALPTHGSAHGAFVAVDTLGQIWYTQGVGNNAADPNNYVGVLQNLNAFKDWQVPSLGADLRGININPLTQQPWVAEYAHAGSGAAKVAVLDPSTGGTVNGVLSTSVGWTGGVTNTAPAVLGPLAVTTNAVVPASASNMGTTTGPFTEWALNPTSGPHDLVVDSTGAVWIAEANGNKIAKLTLTQPDFTLSPAPPTISIPQGGSGMVTITGTSLLSFSGSVALSVTGSVPAGVSFSAFSPNPIAVPSGGSLSATLTINVAPSASVGTSTITVTGTGPSSVLHTTSFALTITSGADFSLSLSSPTLSVGAGSSATDTASITSMGSFNSAVALSASSLPGGVHVTFSSPSVTPPAGGTVTSDAMISVDSGTLPSVTGITITGMSGSLTHSQPLTLTITVTPDFTISGNPVSIPIIQGATGTSTITATSINGFNSAVALSYSWVGSAPTGVTASLPSPVTPTSGTPATSILTVSTTSSSSTGSFTLSVTGMSGALTHSANLAIQISAAAAPKCLIATATYGSELSPEVQLLRNFRDYSIMKTQSGSNFMVAFNAWYYSFSPYVANYLITHWVERTIMKGVLYPLIGILYLTSNLYSTTSTYPELAALLSGLLASSLIGGFYLGLPMSLLRARVRRLRGLRAQSLLQKLLGVSLLGGMAALLLGEILSSSLLLMVSSATIVLSTLFLSAALTSAKVARRLHSRI
ncbi:MAG: CFI-box-CTERM domain-containing protein [Candidatus Bathyarchaeia archaeon]